VGQVRQSRSQPGAEDRYGLANSGVSGVAGAEAKAASVGVDKDDCQDTFRNGNQEMDMNGAM
jgi:hypothetical protein